MRAVRGVLPGEPWPCGGCPGIPGSLAIHAAGIRPSDRGHRVPGRPAANPPVTRAGRRPGRSTHQPDAPRAAPVALPPGPVPGPAAGRDRLRVISSIYIRHCGPTPRCR